MMDKKCFKTVISFISLSTFVVALVLCCCVERTAQASVQHVKAKALPACHSHKGSAPKPLKGDCGCCSLKKLNAQEVVKTSVAPAESSLTQAFVFSYPGFSSTVIKQKYNLAYLDGPPGLRSTVALYLLHHSIRC